MKNRFPRWVFSRVILIQALLTLSLFGFLGLWARSYFQSSLKTLISEQQLEAILSDFDTAFLFSLAGLSILLGTFAVILARHLIFPIGRMIVKTRSVLAAEDSAEAEAKSADQISRSSQLDEEEEPEGAWSDLASSIEDIRKDLQAKIESLKTEREEQATLMGAISEAILAVDLEEAPLFYNTRFALQFANQLPDHHPSAPVASDSSPPQRLWQIFRAPEILDAYHRALNEGRTEDVKALPFDLPNGKRFISLSVSPLRNSKEAIYGAVGIFHDVTDLKRAEQIRIDFVANVSHELRTPLTAIKGYADTLQLDLLAGHPVTPEFLQIIVRNTDRLMNLINDLLDLSSLESTDFLSKVPLPTEEFTSRILQQISGTISKKRQRVILECEGSTVLADPKRLEQVLTNLLDNAAKYTPEEGTLTVNWSENDGNTVLRVSDTGPGIPAEHQARLFERFYRVDKDRSREKGGTGLGLAIVKHIMQRHEGTVSVESSPGKGSIFSCKFPNSAGVNASP